ncbi:nucleotide exchange factor Sil1 [Topomyia yanbarensis]|uniref:nucleotide exchange factor Sil1 n=1 Tax=Topomyia yanbarensis TaxID=2498891 RepID=UPI00273BDCD9|nr:nucleotide exchange factor Sil1 [Topomyia yanbarensis]
MISKWSIFLLTSQLVAFGCGAANSTKFVATKEWQEIPDGQPIPDGLHIRINLSTGKKEAKLLDKATNDTQSSSLSTVPGAGLKDHDNGQVPFNNDIEQLKEALQKIPSDDLKLDEKELKKVKGKYKSYDQIKQDLKEANMEVKSDSDIMQSLFKRFREIWKSKNPAEFAVKAELETLFADLQYLVHQIDNANEFIDRQGIEEIIWPSLNQTEPTLRINSLKLLGTVVQNNPKAKVALFERNGGSILLARISQSKKVDEISAGLFAFGNLVRKFPYAMAELLTPHSYSLLFDVLDKGIDLRVKVKIIRLLSDLVQDYEHALSEPDVDETIRERYRSTNLKATLHKVEYCQRARDFLLQNKPGLVLDGALLDDVVGSLRSIRQSLCHEVWSKCAMFRHILLVLRNSIETRFSERDGSQQGAAYVMEIQDTIEQFVDELYGYPFRRDEL